MVAEFLHQFVVQITEVTNKVTPNIWRTLYILIALNVTWAGIEIALGKHELPGLIEKLFSICLVLFLVKNFRFISFTFLHSLLGLTGGGDTSILENPEQIFIYAHEQILNPISASIEGQFAQTGGLGLLTLGAQQIGFFLIYGIFIIAIYICFAVIVVQIVIAYLTFLITMLFGLILLPFTVFKPLEFIGKNVFSAMLSQALTIAVIVFVAQLGLAVFGRVVTQSALTALASRGKLNVAVLWTILACVFIYFYLCLKAPTLVMTLMSGSPALGAGGLFTAIATAAALLTRGVQPPSGNFSSNVNAPPTPGGQVTQSPTSPPAGGRFMPQAASASSGVNTVASSGPQTQTSSQTSGTFLPQPHSHGRSEPEPRPAIQDSQKVAS